MFPTLAQPVHVVLDPQDIVLFTTLPRICSWQQSMPQKQHQNSRQMHLAGTAQRFREILLTQQCSLGGLLRPGNLMLVLNIVKRGLRIPWPEGLCIQYPPGFWDYFETSILLVVDDESAVIAAQSVFKSCTKRVKQEEFFCLFDKSRTHKEVHWNSESSFFPFQLMVFCQTQLEKREAGEETRSLP